MKKIIMFLCSMVAVLLLAGSFSFNANAEMVKQYEYNGFVYEKWGKDEVYINKYIGKKKKLVIPEILKGKKVVGVGVDLGNVEEVHFPDGMGISVDYGLKLKKVTINESNDRYIVKNNLLLSKDGTSLQSCPGGIKNPKIPDSVEIIDVCSLGRGITTLKLGKNVKQVEDNAFGASSDKLKKIIFNKKLEEIGYNAFSYSTSLKEVAFPKSLKSIGDEAFKHCTSLKTIKFSSNLKSIGEEAFSQCTSLKSVTIPSNVKTIKQCAFAECDNLKSIYIYNKDCKIVRGYYKQYVTIPRTTTIYGYKGSTAEKYAERFGNPFVALKKTK